MIILHMKHIHARCHACRNGSTFISQDRKGAEDEHPSFGVTSRSNSTRASFLSRSYTLIKPTIFRNCHDGTEAGYATSFAPESRLFFMPTHS